MSPELPPLPQRRSRLLYSLAALLLLAAMLIGFHHYYLQGKAHPGREVAPPIRTLVLLHGASMTAWMLLFGIQPLLIATARRRVHMILGRVGAVIAIAVIVFGIQLAIASVRVTPPEVRIWGLPAKAFMAVPVTAMVTFGIFVGLGVWHRCRPEFHRAMMLLATLAVIPAAISRIDAISGLYQGTALEPIFGPFLGMIGFGTLFLGAKAAAIRPFNRAYAVGFAVLVASCLLTMQLARTAAWDGIASFLLR